MRRLIVLSSVLILLAAACGDDDEMAPEDGATTTSAATTTSDGADPTTTTPAGSRAEATATCRAAEFSVDYPADWEVATGSEADACRWFHPEPFELPENSEVLDIAIHADLEPAPYERVAEGVTSGPHVAEVTLQEDEQVAGAAALRAETVSSGEALYPEGTRVYTYVVDASDGAFVASTTGLVDGYERNRAVLDEMMASLAFRAG